MVSTRGWGAVEPTWGGLALDKWASEYPRLLICDPKRGGLLLIWILHSLWMRMFDSGRSCWYYDHFDSGQSCQCFSRIRRCIQAKRSRPKLATCNNHNDAGFQCSTPSILGQVWSLRSDYVWVVTLAFHVTTHSKSLKLLPSFYTRHMLQLPPKWGPRRGTPKEYERKEPLVYCGYGKQYSLQPGEPIKIDRKNCYQPVYKLVPGIKIDQLVNQPIK